MARGSTGLAKILILSLLVITGFVQVARATFPMPFAFWKAGCAGPPTTGASSIAIDSATMASDGATYATITLTLKAGCGAISGTTPTYTVTGNAATVASITASNALGISTAHVTSTTNGITTITVATPAALSTFSVQVRFVTGHALTTIAATSAPVLTARQDMSIVWTGSKAIVWGGGDNTTSTNTYSDGGIYDPINDTWNTALTASGLHSREEHAAVWAKNVSKMLIWGGYFASNTALGDGSMFDPSGAGTWTAMTATSAPWKRFEMVADWDDVHNQMIIYHGVTDTANARCPSVDTTYCQNGGFFDPASGANGTWTDYPAGGTTSGGPAHGRRWAGAVWASNIARFIVWGGNMGGASRNDGAYLDPSVAGGWTTISAVTAPSIRDEHALVWDPANKSVIVWGGWASTPAYLQNGGILNLSSGGAGTWTAIPNSGPSARADMFYAFTGKGLFVWGGSSGAAGLKDGALYTIGTGWGATITPAVFNGRGTGQGQNNSHGAWTGGSLFIWGGDTLSSFGTVYNTGALITP